MPNLLAMSFEGELAPSFSLDCLTNGNPLPDGWGLGYYPAGEPSVAILKEPAPAQNSIRSQLAQAWEQVESTIFVMHIRHATWGAVSDANTQPFTRSWGRRDWMLAHAGSLDHKPDPNADPALFEPVGSTDTEQVFCTLLNRLVAQGHKSLMDADLDELHRMLCEINLTGELNMCLTDGRDLLAYADRRGTALWLADLRPPYERITFGDDDLTLDLTRRGAKSRKGVIVCTSRLRPGDGDAGHALNWQQLQPGQMVLIRQGAQVDQRGAEAPARLTAQRLPRPLKAEPKRLRVTHRTHYKYLAPIERSMHVLRLTPMHDRLQTLVAHDLAISVAGHARDYDDVFGNRVRRLMVETPFTEMTIESNSEVHLLDLDPLSFRPLRSRSTIPLAWMPWQRQALNPYLLPPELPESELAELVEYAMSFVKRNDYDLIDTLLDINETIFREYKYQQGSTNLFTTAFDVYVNRRGVCQDFTNLFICLARLLNIPARYVCGYLYCGPTMTNQVQAQASHAWLQLYLPEVGWKGFDPTNGVLTQTDHVRVAIGRNYSDATPTSGTIFVGNLEGELLSVDVAVTRLP